MATTYTTNKLLSKMATGDAVGSWGPVLDTNMDIIDTALGGQVVLTLSSTNVTLTQSQANNLVIGLNGTLTAQVTVTVPAVPSIYMINNTTAGSFGVTFASAGGGTSLLIHQGKYILYCDGGNIFAISSTYKPFFRMDTPSTTVNSGVLTTVGNYANGYNQFLDSYYNLTTGVVRIGTQDSGVYNLNACCGCGGPNEQAGVYILLNGVVIAYSFNPSIGDAQSLNVSTSTIVNVAPGDALSMSFFQANNAGNPDTTKSALASSFSGARVS